MESLTDEYEKNNIVIKLFFKKQLKECDEFLKFVS